MFFNNLKLILPFSSSSTRTIKLCDNDLSPKKGNTGYDPAYKYDFAFKALIHNCNEMTFQADLDQCGDETTMGHSGYGESGSGLCARVMGKPGITKGMQTVLLADVHRNRPRAYLHRHKVCCLFLFLLNIINHTNTLFCFRCSVMKIFQIITRSVGQHHQVVVK